MLKSNYILTKYKTKRSNTERTNIIQTGFVHLIKELPVYKKCVVWFGQLSSQKGEESAHLGGREVWVVHHHLRHQKNVRFIR